MTASAPVHPNRSGRKILLPAIFILEDRKGIHKPTASMAPNIAKKCLICPSADRRRIPTTQPSDSTMPKPNIVPPMILCNPAGITNVEAGFNEEALIMLKPITPMIRLIITPRIIS